MRRVNRQRAVGICLRRLANEASAGVLVIYVFQRWNMALL
jgi:hypothetical protein